MTDHPVGGTPPLRPLILIPALITLAVTLLRLIGERRGWSPTLFSREAGGGLAIVGIVWLVPVFGIYLAVKLIRMGQAPASIGRALGVSLVALLIIPASLFLGAALRFPQGGRRSLLLVAVASIAALLVGLRAWPALGRVLFAYGLAARIPVAVVMLVAILADWGTHYEKGAPGFPQMGALAKWFWIGLISQMTLWMAFTVVVGALFGGLTALATARWLKPATVWSLAHVHPCSGAPATRRAAFRSPRGTYAPGATGCGRGGNFAVLGYR